MIAEYGKRLGDMITEGNIELGMTKEMIRCTWGPPEYRIRYSRQDRTYCTNALLTFTGDKLTVMVGSDYGSRTHQSRW